MRRRHNFWIDPSRVCGSNTLPSAVRVLVVTHMTPSESHPERGAFVDDQVKALKRRAQAEVEFRRFPPGALSYLVTARKLRRSGRGFDVVHAHYGLSGWSALAARAPRRVVTFHGTDIRHRLVGPLSRLLVRLIDLPATVSASLARSGVPGAGSRRRVAVLPCGVDLERFRELDRRDARARLGLDQHRPYLLFPADPGRAVKRYDRACSLCARVPGAALLPLRGVPPNEVPFWVNASTAVLITSDHEGFGLAALEALACNVPVLSTPVGVAPLALEGIAGTACEPFSEERWLAALQAHVQAPDPRIAGRARAELFSSERMAQRVLAAYRELAA
jgi:teichuronic acid biosynthesis glycosyltransferase TuaC